MTKGKTKKQDDEYFHYKDPKWKKRQNCHQGPWEQKEKTLYFNFLKENVRIFQSSELRRSKKAFQKLSYALKKRSPAQCRSRYQKLEQKYGTDIHQMIRKLEREEVDKKRHQIPVKKQEKKKQTTALVEPNEELIEGYLIDKKGKGKLSIILNLDIVHTW